jgi:spore coat protein A, manganese oxidase
VSKNRQERRLLRDLDAAVPQQILPAGLPATTVWGYGAVASASKRGCCSTTRPRSPSRRSGTRPVRIKWINELVDANGNYLPHLLPVDPTLHWANPPGGVRARHAAQFTSTPGPYTGPVPMVTHVHGAVGVGDESDGYAEAWYLPAANNIPAATPPKAPGTTSSPARPPPKFGASWGPGLRHVPVPEHEPRLDHLVPRPHAGHDPAQRLRRPGRLLHHPRRAGRRRRVLDSARARPPCCPVRRRENDKFPPNKTYYEIPIAIQDRSFNADGSLFYPDTRAFFDEIAGPYIPDTDISPIWNPEFFGNMIMVNGNTWPFQTVEQRRYRFRFLNGCQSRFLILDFNATSRASRSGRSATRAASWPRRSTSRDERQPAADGPGRARRRDRRLHQRAGGQTTCSATSAPTSRSAAACPARTSTSPTRRHRARSWSSGSCPRWRPTRPPRRSSCSCRPSPRCRRRR